MEFGSGPLDLAAEAGLEAEESAVTVDPVARVAEPAASRRRTGCTRAGGDDDVDAVDPVVSRAGGSASLRISDKSTADTSVINSRRPPAASGLQWSPVQSAGPGSTDIDSDAVPETTTTGQFASTEVTTGAPGTVDHTIDAGLFINRL
ncbi:hypothetical protein ACFVRB_42310 [Streptomyces nojiriensis]|uniref:hypothetical protein n=1 Tax=Streptomyces nojiriensis TaxID=66374 RepID=UPI0036DCD270